MLVMIQRNLAFLRIPIICLLFLLMSVVPVANGEMQDEATLTHLTPITLRNVAEVQHLATLRLDHIGISSIDWSADGRVLAVGGGRGGLLYDLDGLDKPTQFTTESVLELAFSPTESLLAYSNLPSLSQDGFYLYDLNTGQVRTIRHRNVFSFAFSPNGSRLATGGNYGDIYIWDVMSGARLARLRMNPNNLSVTSLTFNDDGSQLAGEQAVGGISIWSLENIQQNRVQDTMVVAEQFLYGPIAFDRSGSLIVAAWDDWINPSASQMIDVNLEAASGQRTLNSSQRFTQDWPIIHDFGLIDNDALLVSVNDDNTLYLWDFARGTLLKSLTGQEAELRLNKVAINPQATVIATAGYDTGPVIHLWGIPSAESP